MTPSNTVPITNEILNVIHQYKSLKVFSSQVKGLRSRIPVTISNTSYNLEYQLQPQKQLQPQYQLQPQIATSRIQILSQAQS